jgi:hypothetical protein
VIWSAKKGQKHDQKREKMAKNAFGEYVLNLAAEAADNN